MTNAAKPLNIKKTNAKMTLNTKCSVERVSAVLHQHLDVHSVWKSLKKSHSTTFPFDFWNETFLMIFKHCAFYLLMLVAEWLWNVICLAKKVSKYSSFHVHKSHKIGLVLLPNSWWWWLILLSLQDNWGSQEEHLQGVLKLIIAGFPKDRVTQNPKNIISI